MIALQSFHNPGIINMKLLGQLLNIIQMSFQLNTDLLNTYCVPGMVLSAVRYRKNKTRLLLWRYFQSGGGDGHMNRAQFLLWWWRLCFFMLLIVGTLDKGLGKDRCWGTLYGIFHFSCICTESWQKIVLLYVPDCPRTTVGHLWI